ncbi:hypothetical protein A9G47_12270 [Gilliamella sp. WF3-4]|nr:hypothetical protein A9G47_12270 [Gilliamella apicola]
MDYAIVVLNLWSILVQQGLDVLVFGQQNSYSDHLRAREFEPNTLSNPTFWLQNETYSGFLGDFVKHLLNRTWS